MRQAFFTVALILVFSSFSFAQTRPARRGGGPDLERLRTSLQSLDLSDQQKSQIREILTETRTKIQAMRKSEDGGATREQVIGDVRKRVADILTPAQRDKLRDALGDLANPPTSRPSEKPSEKTASAAPSAVSSKPDQRSPTTGPTLIDIASRAPNFTLPRTGGPNVSLSQFEGKYVLIVFGAYSSPTFRERAPQLEQLRKDFGSKLNAVVIYTKEPHAKGEWEVDRNGDIGIEISQARTMAERTATAKQMQTALKLTVPVVVDAIDNTTAGAYGAESDSAILVGRDGTVVFRQKWFDPYAMRRAIESTLNESK